VDVGGTVVQIAAGGGHTCALLADGAVRCWGRNNLGQLGLGNTLPIGDNELPSSVDPVDLGGAAVQIAAGRDHTCALLEGGSVRCWGEGTLGRLGYGNTTKVGDNELPSTRGPVDLGGAAVQIAAGGTHTCAVLDTGAVRCWGFGLYGQLGYGNTLNVGDSATRLPSAAGDVPVGAPVAELVLGDNHSCARLESRAVRCWGRGDKGELGYGSVENLGDDEVLTLSDIDLGDPTVHLATGATHNCALLEAGAVRCWGNGGDGRLGYGNVTVIGDDETPQSAGDVSLP
jgi:alpha-tubulin suppressor-like RCC1 family protein